MGVKVIVIGGGTGGHIFPALAVADELKKRGMDVHWLGTKTGMENKIVKDAGYPFHAVQLAGVRRTGWRGRMVAPFNLVRALVSALLIVHRIKPAVVLGMGGYASAPGSLIAYLYRIPLVIHEQNAVSGFTNCLLSHLATVVLSAFPDTFSSGFLHVIGNPVRDSILALPEKKERKKNTRLRLLVLGGSQGAAVLNKRVPQALVQLSEDQKICPIEVWHLTGDNKCDETRLHYENILTASNIDNDAKIEPFCHDMAKAYDWADIVLCRAGAMTVSELAAAGLPSILVPYPYAVDDHQTANAKYLADVNAAVLIQQPMLTVDELAKQLLYFYSNPSVLAAMAHAARAMSKPDATHQAATFCQRAAGVLSPSVNYK